MPPRKRKPSRPNRVARVAAGACVLAAASFAQYYLAKLPLPVDLDATNKFSPAVVRLNQEELVIEDPVVEPADSPLLGHEGRGNEAVVARFDHALLDEQTVEELSGPELRLPPTPGEIDYTPPDAGQTPSSGGLCQTSIDIRVNEGQPPRSLHFYQLEAAGADRRRHLEMKAGGAPLSVELSTSAEGADPDETEGCGRLLRVGDLPRLSLPDSMQVTAVAAADSTFRFSFRPLAPDAPLWDGGPEGFLKPFDLGPPPVKPDAPPPFQARAVSVRKLLKDHPDAPPVLSARSEEGGPLLRVYDLEVGSAELRIKVSGRGAVSVNGQPETVDLLKRVQEHPLLAAVLTALNAALLAWFVRLLTSRGAPRAVKK